MDMNGTRKTPLIQVVDDEASMRMMMRTSLEQTGFEVVEAENGVAAISDFKRLRPDAVLLDVMMPELDGFATCKEIRLLPEGEHTPVLMITGLEDIESIHRAFEVGATDFVAKPLNWVMLGYRVRYMLRASRAFHDLKKSQRQLDKAQHIARVGHWEMNLATRTILCSTEFCRIMDLHSSGGELPYEALSDPVHPDDKDEARAIIDEAVETKRPYSVNYRIVSAGGLERFIHNQGEVVFDEIHNQVFMMGIIQDITERKEAGEALRSSEKKFRRLSREFQALLDGIPDILVLLSPDMEIVWANRAAAGYLGRKADSHAGKTCYSLWHDRLRPCGACPVTRAFASGEVEESTVAAPDGTKWELKALPLKNKEGKVANVIELATDVTEKSRLRLEAERAGRLASLGELAAGVAHEINNPNALIRINSSILAKGVPDFLPILEAHYREHGDFRAGELDYSDLREELPDLFSEMQEASGRIKRIVEDLKDFARPAGYGRTEAIEVNAAVEAALRLCGHSIKKWTNNFAVDYGEALPPVSGDFQGVVQVAVNLVVNACQALPEKEKGVFVSTFFEKGRDRVVLQVRDEGGGIAEKDMPHITDPFFTTRREVGGTGLGLSVCARIVKEMGASLSFDSRLGEGATATLSMPPLQEEVSRR